jgi:hypothetical protein
VKTGGGRLVVVVAVVVVGILVLAKGLQGSSAAVAGGGTHTTPPAQTSPTPSVSGSHSPGGGGGGSPTGNLPSPKQSGVLIALFNATNTNGLAGATATKLEAKGYVLAGQPGNLPPSTQTVIYYKNDQGKADAQHLQQLAIPEAKIKPLPKNLPAQAAIPDRAELVVVLGSDYAQSHPVGA